MVKIDKLVKVDKLQKTYGVKQITPKVKSFKKSTVKNKKYTVILEDGTRVNFGHTAYKHYKDKKGLFKSKDHNDKERRKRYLARATRIKNKNGSLTMNDPKSANFWAIRVLW